MLKYKGNGEWIAGIPAQDLSDTEITRLAGDFSLTEESLIDLLTSRGLYSVVSENKPKRTKKLEDLPIADNEDIDDGS